MSDCIDLCMHLITCNVTHCLRILNSLSQQPFSTTRFDAIVIHLPYATPSLRHLTYASPSLPIVNTVLRFGVDIVEVSE